ncbi:transcriptional regulator, TetR family [Pseudonocardia thermophila]|uniref:Transcriptional regulator, TetR family n=1 Tax=Pseudonocardia thermophila TaxID=1848 RepID=A0A1M6YDV5_PSETH|nr:TetR/AcrR family transcriptional regulator [Pseudonocardia thermophila]SHL16270.1 transcriptional regulator, TetR family [Pseudonocardia thermophila]
MASARVYAGRSAEQRRAERRNRLLAAGLDLFGGQGYRNTSIEALCTAAGVSTRAFYEEFTGREDLLLALHDQVAARAYDAMVETAAALGDVPLPERTDAILCAFVRAACTDPKAARIAFAEVLGVSPAVDQHRLQWRNRFVEFAMVEIGRAIERGEAPQRDHGLTTIALIGAVNELVVEWVVRGRTVPLETIATEAARMAYAAFTAS